MFCGGEKQFVVVLLWALLIIWKTGLGKWYGDVFLLLS
jgi:hypothetical protein